MKVLSKAHNFDCLIEESPGAENSNVPSIQTSDIVTSWSKLVSVKAGEILKQWNKTEQAKLIVSRSAVVSFLYQYQRKSLHSESKLCQKMSFSEKKWMKKAKSNSNSHDDSRTQHKA